MLDVALRVPLGLGRLVTNAYSFSVSLPLMALARELSLLP